ncbi:mRNA-binding ribosome synthesis protein [Binucleata daphniae]
MLNYNRPVKKSVSCRKAARLLKLSEKEFSELAILLNIKPHEFKNRHKDDFEHKLHYKIEDIQKMIDSDAYMTIQKRNKVKKTRKEYIEYGRVERLQRMKDAEFEYMKIIKERYPNFRDAVIDLGQSLTLLFLANKLNEIENNKIEKNNCSKYDKNMNDVEMINCSKYDENIGDVEKEQYKTDMCDLNENVTANTCNNSSNNMNNYKIRHENDKKIIKKYENLLAENEVSKLKREIKKHETNKVLEGYKSFVLENGCVKKCFLMNNGCNYLASIQDIEICWTEPYKIKENIIYDDLDISEIKYLFLFSYYHVKTVLNKLAIIYNKDKTNISDANKSIDGTSTAINDSIYSMIDSDRRYG